MSVWRAREAKNVETYGSARWADAREIRAAGLLGPDGVVLGKLDDDYLRHDGPEHVLCFAPTRSGKGVGLVVPSLLAWPGSAIVHDIKGENWELTAGFRARHGRVLLFDPTNPKSSAYNPLLEVRRGEWEVRDVQNVADVLVDPEGSLDKRNHWEKTSHSLLGMNRMAAEDALSRQVEDEVGVEHWRGAHCIKACLLFWRQVMSSGPMFCASCSGRLAPMRAVNKPGRFTGQASATCAIGRPSSSATARSSSTMRKFPSVNSIPPYGLSPLSLPLLPPSGVSLVLVGRFPAGPACAIFLRPYLPVSSRPQIRRNPASRPLATDRNRAALTTPNVRCLGPACRV
ncbi:hypothetical protein ACVWWP_001342 [Bradyrhizobium sp. LM3.6]